MFESDEWAELMRDYRLALDRCVPGERGVAELELQKIAIANFILRRFHIPTGNLIDFTEPRHGSVPRPLRIKILSAGKCAECVATSSLTVDHIVPTSKGGTSDESNLQCLCFDCNIRKGASLPADRKAAL